MPVGATASGPQLSPETQAGLHRRGDAAPPVAIGAGVGRLRTAGPSRPSATMPIVLVHAAERTPTCDPVPAAPARAERRTIPSGGGVPLESRMDGAPRCRRSRLSLAPRGRAVDRIRATRSSWPPRATTSTRLQRWKPAPPIPDSAQRCGRLLLARTQAVTHLTSRARAEAAGDLDPPRSCCGARCPSITGQRVSTLLATCRAARRPRRCSARRPRAKAGRPGAEDRHRRAEGHRRHAACRAAAPAGRRPAPGAGARPAARPVETRPICSTSRTPPRSVLDVVSATGINFVLDKTSRRQRVTVYAKDVRFEDALDMSQKSQLARKVLDSKTV